MCLLCGAVFINIYGEAFLSFVESLIESRRKKKYARWIAVMVIMLMFTVRIVCVWYRFTCAASRRAVFCVCSIQKKYYDMSEWLICLCADNEQTSECECVWEAEVEARVTAKTDALCGN